MNNEGTLGKGKKARSKGCRLGAKICGTEVGAKIYVPRHIDATLDATVEPCRHLGVTTCGVEMCYLGSKNTNRLKRAKKCKSF